MWCSCCGSSSGVSFSYNDYDNWNTNSNVSSHLSKILSTTDLAHIAKKYTFNRFVSNENESEPTKQRNEKSK